MNTDFSPLDTSMYPMTNLEMFFPMKFFADLKVASLATKLNLLVEAMWVQISKKTS